MPLIRLGDWLFSKLGAVSLCDLLRRSPISKSQREGERLAQVMDWPGVRCKVSRVVRTPAKLYFRTFSFLRCPSQQKRWPKRSTKKESLLDAADTCPAVDSANSTRCHTPANCTWVLFRQKVHWLEVFPVSTEGLVLFTRVQFPLRRWLPRCSTTCPLGGGLPHWANESSREVGQVAGVWNAMDLLAD